MPEYTPFLSDTFLFKNIPLDEINCLIKNLEIEEKVFAKGSVIYSPDEFQRKIGFVTSGACTVCRSHGTGNTIPLNSIKKYDSFGIVSVFTQRDEFPTTIISDGECSILFFNESDLYSLVKTSSQVSINLIEYLTKKIVFLNDKIASFSGGCIEEKLAGYILELYRKKQFSEFEFNKKKSAESLNCGRASLYRAIYSLEEKGYVKFENKTIKIIDINGLERMLK